MSYQPTEEEKAKMMAGAPCSLDSRLLTCVVNTCIIHELLGYTLTDIMLQYPARALALIGQVEGRLGILKEQIAQVPNMEPATKATTLPVPKTIGQTGDVEPRRWAESETGDAS